MASDLTAEDLEQAAAELIPATELLPAVPARETAHDEDGWIFDVQTGEVLGRLDVAELFQINSDDAAEWALELRSRLEGDLVGIDARLRALTAMLEALRAEKMRRLAWWDWRFAPDLVAYSRTKLKGTRSKTAKFAWGQVSFRSTQGSHTILSMEEAVDFVRAWAPSKVKVVETVSVKDVLATVEVVAQATGEAPERPSFLAHSGESESVTIKTGIELKLPRVKAPKMEETHDGD